MLPLSQSQLYTFWYITGVDRSSVIFYSVQNKADMARPRSFDTADALAAATQVFLARGFDGATLDDLTEAMGINKPSLYAAFGDKGALYAAVLGGYAASAMAAMETALNSGHTLHEATRNLLIGAIDQYAPLKHDPLGCLVATTATTVAGSNPDVRKVLAAFLTDVDRLIRETIERRFAEDVTPTGAALVTDLLTGTLFSLAIRARARIPRKQLLAVAERAIESIGMIEKA